MTSPEPLKVKCVPPSFNRLFVNLTINFSKAAKFLSIFYTMVLNLPQPFKK